MTRSVQNQKSIERLKQAMEALEGSILATEYIIEREGATGAAATAFSLEDGTRFKLLETENAELKLKQEKVKKRLDSLIRQFSRHIEEA